MFSLFFPFLCKADEQRKNRFLASQIGADALSIHGIEFNEAPGSNISIPNSLSKNGISFNVIELKESAFRETPAGSYYIPESISVIGRKCFSDCKLLCSVNLSQTKVQKLKERTFSGCSKLSNVYLPSTITEIEEGSFENCVELKSIFLKSTEVRKINKNVFCGCCSLENIDFPDSLQYIGSKAFTNTKIKRFSFSGKFNFLAVSAFENCLIEIIDLSKTMITVIESNTFSGCSMLEHIHLPKDLNQIRENAFYKTGIQSIDLSHTRVEDIEENAFSCSPYLRKVKFPKTIKTIGKNAFSNCSFVNFEVCPSITNLGKGFMSDNAKLEFVNMSSSSLESIPDEAFSNCFILSMISFPTKEISFGMRSFSNTAIKSIVISNNIVSIGKECFFNCKELLEVSMKDSKILKIPEGCFRDCCNLNSFVYPQNGFDVSKYCFDNCAFNEVSLPAVAKSLEECCFWNSLKLEKVSLLETNITEIPIYAFANCPLLKTVILPASITSISPSSFDKSPICLICFFGMKSPEGIVKSKVVSVPKDYVGETFCGVAVTRNITKGMFKDRKRTIISMFWASIIIGIVVIIVSVVIFIYVSNRLIRKGDFENLLSSDSIM